MSYETSRGALIKELRNADAYIGVENLVNILFKLVNKAADMLEADAQWRSMYEQREDEAHELSEQIIKLQAQQAQQAADDEYYLIFFADADCRPEIFNSRSAALHRYEQVSTSWNAHLFVRLDSNSRGSSPPVQQVTAPAGFVLVPIKMTPAMIRITDQDDWQWADVLAAAEAINEDQYAASTQGCDAQNGYATLYANLADAMGYTSGKDGMEYSPEEWAERLLKDASAFRHNAQQVSISAKKRESLDDKARLDWLDQNIFNRENLDLCGKLDQTYNMWVMFAPKGVQGSARAIIDSAMLIAQQPQGDKA